MLRSEGKDAGDSLPKGLAERQSPCPGGVPQPHAPTPAPGMLRDLVLPQRSRRVPRALADVANSVSDQHQQLRVWGSVSQPVSHISRKSRLPPVWELFCPFSGYILMADSTCQPHWAGGRPKSQQALFLGVSGRLFLEEMRV